MRDPESILIGQIIFAWNMSFLVQGIRFPYGRYMRHSRRGKVKNWRPRRRHKLAGRTGGSARRAVPAVSSAASTTTAGWSRDTPGGGGMVPRYRPCEASRHLVFRSSSSALHSCVCDRSNGVPPCQGSSFKVPVLMLVLLPWSVVALAPIIVDEKRDGAGDEGLRSAARKLTWKRLSL